MPVCRWLLLAPLAGLLLLFGPPLSTTPATADPTKDKDKPQPTAGPVSYYRDIRRVFQQNCQGCHQPARPMGGYVMTTYAALLKPGDSNKKPVEPSQPDKSELIAQITPDAAMKKALMPKNKEPLAPGDLALVRRWIAEGAKDDTPKSAQDIVDDKNPPVYKLPPIVTAIDFSPDGSLLAVSGHHEVLIHNLQDETAPPARLIGLSERVQSLAFSPDGKSLAVAGGSPGRFGELQVWDVAKKRLRYSISVTFDTLYGVSWSPDSSTIAFGCADNSIRAIEAATGKQILFQGAHSDWVLGTVFSQDGEHVVSVSRDMSMKLTVVKTQRFVDNITSITPGKLKGGLQAVALRPSKGQTKVKSVDGSDKLYDELLIGGSDGTPRLYKMHRVKQRTINDDDNFIRSYAEMPGRLFALRFNKDGSRFAAGSSLDGQGEVRIYETDSAKMLSKLDKVPSVYTLAFSPDGKVLASAGFDGVIRLSDPSTGKVLKQFVAVPLTKAK